MSIPKDLDHKLKFGNLFLALMFAVVPTAMTIGFLGVHGVLLCRTLETKVAESDKLELNELCLNSNIEANYDYIIWVWLFITIPTWRWFYVGHYRRVQQKSANN